MMLYQSKLTKTNEYNITKCWLNLKDVLSKDKNTIKQNKNCKISKYKLIMLQITPNLHLKRQRWHRIAFEVAFRYRYTDSLMLLRGGMNAFTQQLHIPTVLWYWDGSEQASFSLALCGIVPLHNLLSRHRATLTWLCKDTLSLAG